jgi:hypothetical protein
MPGGRVEGGVASDDPSTARCEAATGRAGFGVELRRTEELRAKGLRPVRSAL